MAAGFAGQALFTARVLLQWLASERAGRVVIPRSYWALSLAASLLLLAYAGARGDAVLAAGPLLSAAVFARNLMLPREDDPALAAALEPRARLALALLLAALLAVAVAGSKVVRLDAPAGWLAVGVLGQALWLSRNLVQWWIAERLGRSTLPPSYFATSLAGGLLLLAYACWRRDPVFALAYVLAPIPYARSLALAWRTPRAEAPAPERAS